MKRRLAGVFEVTLTPEPDEFPQGRRLAKRCFGALDGTGEGPMLSFISRIPGSAGCVAIERVTGTLAGRAGSFVLQHSGTMTRGEPALSVVVVPDSGTDALVGIAGRMDIRIEPDGRHVHELEVTLP